MIMIVTVAVPLSSPQLKLGREFNLRTSLASVGLSRLYQMGCPPLRRVTCSPGAVPRRAVDSPVEPRQPRGR